MREHNRAFMHTGEEGVPTRGEGLLRPEKLELEGTKLQDRYRNSTRDMKR
jgi:hypothetical protein